MNILRLFKKDKAVSLKINHEVLNELRRNKLSLQEVFDDAIIRHLTRFLDAAVKKGFQNAKKN